VLSTTYCFVRYEGAELDSIQASVSFLLGLTRQSFDRGLTAPEYRQLPASEGLGYSWIQEQDGEDAPAIGRALLSRGDYLIEVDLVSAEGRDLAEDAIRLAQQVGTALDIPDEWTLDEPRPRR
jgi:hypothetical protein